MASATNKKNTKDLIITRILYAPRELVWNAWTQPMHFMKWWGPKGFTSPVSNIDLRVGGEYLNCMQSPDGQRFWSKGVFREIIPLEKLVMTDSFADEKGNIVQASYYGLGKEFPLEMLITVKFEDHYGRTKVTMKHSGIDNISTTDRDNMREGWNQSFDKLAEYLEKEKSQ
jgi:uncharacterized protein YndB with AHSA1/START domain